MSEPRRDLTIVDASDPSTSRGLARGVSGTVSGIVRPLVDPTAAGEAMRQYEALKSAIVQPSDKQIFKQRVNKGTRDKPEWKLEEKLFLKKSFWRRIATYFGLSLELVEEERIVRENGVLAYSALYRAIAPNGQSMIGDGYCDSAEKDRMTEHSIRATAHTRAKNRAISDLVGGGEVSAEEVFPGGADEDDEERPRRTAPSLAAATSDGQSASAKKRDWGSLIRHAQQYGIGKTLQEFEDICADATGSNVALKKRTPAEYDKVEAYIARLIEQRQVQTQPPEPAQAAVSGDEYDLHDAFTERVTP